MATSAPNFNCPTVKKLVRVDKFTFSGLSGLGDESPATQVGYRCEHEDTCPPDGNWQSCPVRQKNLDSQ